MEGGVGARVFLAHPLLGWRYRECVAAVRAQLDADRSLEAVFGQLDAMKFRSWALATRNYRVYVTYPLAARRQICNIASIDSTGGRR